MHKYSLDILTDTHKGLFIQGHLDEGLLLISSCPPQSNTASPDALLCELHVLQPAYDPDTRLYYKVIIIYSILVNKQHMLRTISACCAGKTQSRSTLWLPEDLVAGPVYQDCLAVVQDMGPTRRCRDARNTCHLLVPTIG